MVNLGKTKIMVFNTSQGTTCRERSIFDGPSAEVITSYTCLAVPFMNPIFTMRPAMQAHLRKGHATLAKLMYQCFHPHFLIARSLLFDSHLRPIGTCGSSFWRSNISQIDWSHIERLHIMLLAGIIHSQPSVPHQIVLAICGTPLNLDEVFQVVLSIELGTLGARHPNKADCHG